MLTSQSTSSLLRRAFSFYAELTRQADVVGAGSAGHPAQLWIVTRNQGNELIRLAAPDVTLRWSVEGRN